MLLLAHSWTALLLTWAKEQLLRLYSIQLHCKTKQIPVMLEWSIARNTHYLHVRCWYGWQHRVWQHNSNIERLTDYRSIRKQDILHYFGCWNVCLRFVDVYSKTMEYLVCNLKYEMKKIILTKFRMFVCYHHLQGQHCLSPRRGCKTINILAQFVRVCHYIEIVKEHHQRGPEGKSIFRKRNILTYFQMPQRLFVCFGACMSCWLVCTGMSRTGRE